MATPAAVLALIRASRPTFRSSHDRVAFAVHATLSVNGLRLLAVGDAVDTPAALQATDEVPVDGWNASEGSYAFLYSLDDDDNNPSAGPTSTSAPGPAPGAAPGRRLMVKALSVDSLLLVSLLVVSTANEAAEPEALELDVDQYTTTGGVGGAGGGAADKGPGLKEVADLVRRVQKALDEAVGAGGAGAGTAGAGGAAMASPATASGTAADGSRATEGSGPSGRQGPPPPPAGPLLDDRDPLLIRRGPPPGNPLLDDDMMGEDYLPAGVPRPYPGFGPGMGPLGPTGGGMHVGPGHPFFSGQSRHPHPMGPGGPGGPGGVRWDPIAPEGLQGWRPEDFRRDRTREDGFNDIGRPAPGRGTDFDNMFG